MCASSRWHAVTSHSRCNVWILEKFLHQRKTAESRQSRASLFDLAGRCSRPEERRNFKIVNFRFLARPKPMLRRAFGDGGKNYRQNVWKCASTEVQLQMINCFYSRRVITGAPRLFGCSSAGKEDFGLKLPKVALNKKNLKCRSKLPEVMERVWGDSSESSSGRNSREPVQTE